MDGALGAFREQMRRRALCESTIREYGYTLAGFVAYLGVTPLLVAVDHRDLRRLLADRGGRGGAKPGRLASGRMRRLVVGLVVLVAAGCGGDEKAATTTASSTTSTTYFQPATTTVPTTTTTSAPTTPVNAGFVTRARQFGALGDDTNIQALGEAVCFFARQGQAVLHSYIVTSVEPTLGPAPASYLAIMTAAAVELCADQFTVIQPEAQYLAGN